MHTQARDNTGLALWFAIIWYTIHEHTRLSDYAFLSTCALFGIWKLSGAMLANSVARLGGRAWRVIIGLVVWYALFIRFFPAEFVFGALIVWGVGMPLVLAGAMARHLYERLPGFKNEFASAAWLLGGLAIVTQCFLLWRDGFSVGNVISGSFLFSILASIPLLAGWDLGAPLPQGQRDARFGTEDWFRSAGMSDER